MKKTTAVCFLIMISLPQLSFAYDSQQANYKDVGGGVGASASTQSKGTDTVPYGVKPSIKPPFDASIFWGKMIQLLQRHGGYIEASDIESAFQVKLVQRRNVGSGAYRADIVGGGPWFRNVDYQRYRKAISVNRGATNGGGNFSFLNVLWGYFPGEEGYCERPESLKAVLLGSGWKFSSPANRAADNGTANYMNFTNAKTGSTVDVTYGDGRFVVDTVNPNNACVTSVIVSGRKSS